MKDKGIYKNIHYIKLFKSFDKTYCNKLFSLFSLFVQLALLLDALSYKCFTWLLFTEVRFYLEHEVVMSGYYELYCALCVTCNTDLIHSMIDAKWLQMAVHDTQGPCFFFF